MSDTIEMKDRAEGLGDTVQAFRTAMRRHAASVCIVSVGTGEAVNGMAVTAATSFSMDPPSMLVCVNEDASIAQELQEGVAFGLTLLGPGHEAVAAAFSRKPSGRPRFDHGRWRLEADALPWLEGAPANLACVAVSALSYGTHRALIGRVDGVHLGQANASLIYRDGAYI